MLNPLVWLRRKVAESVISGVHDGLAAITPVDSDLPANLDDLRRVAAGQVKQLAPPVETTETPATTDDAQTPESPKSKKGGRS